MKKIIVFLLSLTISLSPTLLWASAAEQWTIEKVIYNDIGKTLSYTASRPNAIGRNDYIYKAQVGVNAARTGSTAASMIRFGLAGAAIVGIVEGVGWIIDNGAVVKKKQPTTPADSTLQYYFYYSPNTTYYASAWDAANGACLYIATKFPDRACHIITYVGPYSGSLYKFDYTIPDGRTGMALFERQTNPKYNPNAKPQYEPVSDTELGEAIEKSPAAPQVIPNIYSPTNPVPRPSPAPDAVQTALDNADPEPRKPTTSDTEKKPNKDTDADGVPDQYDPALQDVGETTTWPLACEWFPAACEFFKVQKQDNKDLKENQQKQLEQDKTFFEKVKDWFDWSKEEPNLDHDELDIKEAEPFDTSIFSTNRFNVSHQCPVPESHTISLSGVSVDFSFDLKPICDVLDLARPALVACSYLYAAYIVIGAARNG